MSELSPMGESLVQAAGWIEPTAWATSYLAALVWKRFRPCLPSTDADDHRRLGNLGLFGISYALPLLMVPATSALVAMLVAMLVSVAGVGLLSGTAAPTWFVLLLAVLALDLTTWIAHWAMHRSAPLWRVHQVHHSDLSIDSSSSFRVHPLETVLLVLLNALVITLLGLSPAAVIFSSVAAIVFGFFEHANVQLGRRAERVLGLIFITPGLHRVHHSARVADSMCNFGHIFSFWDRLVRTFRPAARGAIESGLEDHRDPQRLSLSRLLLMPFVRSP